MAYLGSLSFSIALLVVSTIITVIYFGLTKPNENKVAKFDLLWLLILCFGIISATAEVRKFQNTWKFNDNLAHLNFSYNELIDDLLTYRQFNVDDYDRALNGKRADSLDFKLASIWYGEQVKLMNQEKDKICIELDSNTWTKVKIQLLNLESKNKFVLDFYEHVEYQIKELNNIFISAVNNNILRKDSDWETVFKVFYPWLIALGLGMRIGKTVYTAYFKK